MADLPACPLTGSNKPFKFSGLDYLGPLLCRQGRSNCKAWGLLFTCTCTRCIHAELVTSLDLYGFLLAFSRFINLRHAVDTSFSNNASTFCAKLFGSTEFYNSLRNQNIKWVKISPYAPRQGGYWEVMVKLFKNALSHVLENSTVNLP